MNSDMGVAVAMHLIDYLCQYCGPSVLYRFINKCAATNIARLPIMFHFPGKDSYLLFYCPTPGLTSWNASMIERARR